VRDDILHNEVNEVQQKQCHDEPLVHVGSRVALQVTKVFQPDMKALTN